MPKHEKPLVMEWLRKLASSRLDAALEGAGGFKRRPAGLTYSRATPSGRQSIEIGFALNPRFAPGRSKLRIFTKITFPAMAKVLFDLYGWSDSDLGKDGVVDRQSIETIMRAPDLLFATESELYTKAPLLEACLVDNVVPYLDERNSEARLVAAKWDSWNRNSRNTQSPGISPIVVASGYVALGDREAAILALETAYPEGSSQRQFVEPAFAYFRR